MSREDEWRSLVDTHYKVVYRYALGFLGIAQEAKDIVQEVYLAAWRKGDSVLRAENPRAWLLRVARNRAIDRRRWWSRWKYSSIAPEGSMTCFDPVERDEMFCLITSLPTRQREVLLLRHVGGFSTAEVARELGISEGTVKSHLSRSRGMLRAALDGEEKP